MPTSLGSIPEDFPSNEVYSVELGDVLPSSVTGRRANFEELVWDQDGGFAPEWAGRSSIGGTGGMGDPYVMLLQRSAFSAAGLALFSYGAGGGGGVGTLAGDVTGPSDENEVTALQGVALPAPAPGVLTYASGVLSWNAASGTGDVIGPASAVNDRVAVFDTTTGKLIKDGGMTIAQVVAAAVAASLVDAVVYQGHSVVSVTTPGGSWTSVTAHTTLTDVIQDGITRSGATWTLSKAGYYRASVEVNIGTVTVAGVYATRVRDTTNNLTLLQHTTYIAPASIGGTSHLNGVFYATAGMTVDVQNLTYATVGNFDPSAVDGETTRMVNIAFTYVGP